MVKRPRVELSKEVTTTLQSSSSRHFLDRKSAVRKNTVAVTSAMTEKAVSAVDVDLDAMALQDLSAAALKMRRAQELQVRARNKNLARAAGNPNDDAVGSLMAHAGKARAPLYKPQIRTQSRYRRSSPWRSP